MKTPFLLKPIIILLMMPVLLLVLSCRPEASGPPRFRGAMLNEADRIRPEDLREFGKDWNANLVRIPFGGMYTQIALQDYSAWIAEQCAALDTLLPVCEEAGLKVCLDLHAPPCGRTFGPEDWTMPLFRDNALQDEFVKTWQVLAEHYKDNKTIIYYDLLNEPSEGNPFTAAPGLLSWRDLAIKVAKVIQAIDDTKKIVFEPIEDNYQWLEPLPLSNIVYSVHVYTPHVLTHQGVIETAPVGVSYPGLITGVYNWPDAYWDKTTLRDYLRHAINFALDNGVEMFVGEFSCVRWAPDNSAYNYIRDCIELFEELGWNWTYHAFREWSGWSVEYDDVYKSATPVSEPTNRQLLLQEYFAKNVKNVKN